MLPPCYGNVVEELFPVFFLFAFVEENRAKSAQKEWFPNTACKQIGALRSIQVLRKNSNNVLDR